MATVSITVGEDHLDKIDEVAAELRTRGMQVDHVLSAVGVISGFVPDERRGSMAAVAGVESVEDETKYQLPPPDSMVQ